MAVKTDIEIAQEHEMKLIKEIVEDIGLPWDANHIEPYGNYKTKIKARVVRELADRPDGKLILVTAITPTPAGEG